MFTRILAPSDASDASDASANSLAGLALARWLARATGARLPLLRIASAADLVHGATVATHARSGLDRISHPSVGK